MLKNKKILSFIRHESFAGMLLIFTSIAALIVANSGALPWYQQFTEAHFFSKPILLWINDGLMAIYFALIGVELKREILAGHLSKPSQILLPGFAALGGIIMPALIFYAFNHVDSLSLKGWAIPTATDIAFSLGILSLLGKRIPSSIKIFLMTIAIFDDFAAILIIAFFYTTHLSILFFILASIAIALLILCNFFNVKKISVYFFIGALLWFFVLKSGVHATLAGVIVAFTIPYSVKEGSVSMLSSIEQQLHPWVAFFIIPLFAFANAGITFENMTLNDALNPLTLGIALGLFVGKPLGIFTTTFLLIKFKAATLPVQAHWRHICGVAVLSGVGFTMSLFISSLAFESLGKDFTLSSKMGIFIGSLGSAIFAYLILNQKNFSIK